MEANMRIKLIAHTPEPEKLVASAAKLCYSSVSAENIMDNLDEEKTRKFVDMLMRLGHESPIEHVSFTFSAEGISRTLSHQLVRHRIASYSQQSQRYVRLEQFDYVIPPSIAAIPEAKKLYTEQMERDQKAYDELVLILKTEHAQRLMNEGMDENKANKAAEKMAIEDARYVFPNACETKLVFTMNARSLLNFFEHRCCNRAQWEIRQMADEMLKQVITVAPSLFKKAGPSCAHSFCSEGNMTCGKMKEVREKYNKIIQGAE